MIVCLSSRERLIEREMATGHSYPTFTCYEKMYNHTNSWQTRKLDSIKHWVALEKIHGANFSFTVSRDSDHGSSLKVKVARRGGYLKERERFFGVYQQKGFIEGEKEKAMQLYSAVCAENEHVDTVTIYGELFGGLYPHPAVEPVPDVTPVQKEVVYCPDLRFIAFDVAIHRPTSGAEPSQERRYLDYDVCMRHFKTAGFLYAEPLATGSLQAMLNYQLGFTSKLPAKLGLPPLPAGSKKNTAEGIVVKPLKDAVLETVKGSNEMRRVIFKRKVEEFTERRHKPHEKRAMSSATANGYSYNQDYELLRYEMLALVTEQRVVNVISKLGLPENEEDWEDIVEAMVEDVREELSSDNEELWTKCQSESLMMEKLEEEMQTQCSFTVEDYREKL